MTMNPAMPLRHGLSPIAAGPKPGIPRFEPWQAAATKIQAMKMDGWTTGEKMLAEDDCKGNQEVQPSALAGQQARGNGLQLRPTLWPFHRMAAQKLPHPPPYTGA
jgi:hypothetical protein